MTHSMRTAMTGTAIALALACFSPTTRAADAADAIADLRSATAATTAANAPSMRRLAIVITHLPPGPLDNPDDETARRDALADTARHIAALVEAAEPASLTGEPMHATLQTLAAIAPTGDDRLADAALAVLSRVAPDDARSRSTAVAVAAQFGLTDRRIEPLAAAWVADPSASPAFIKDAVKHLPGATAAHDDAAKRLLGRPFAELTHDQRITLTYLRPGPDTARALLHAAVDALLDPDVADADFPADPDQLGYPYAALAAADRYRGLLSAADRDRLDAAAIRSDSLRAVMALWLSMLGGDEPAWRARLRDRAPTLIQRWARPDRANVDDLRNPIGRVHDLLLLAMLSDPPRDAKSLAALRSMVNLPTDAQPTTARLRAFEPAGGKWYVNTYAAFSLLWRGSDRPLDELYTTTLGRAVRYEPRLYEYRSTPPGYVVPFALGRIGATEGEPPAARIEAAKSDRAALTLLLHWPRSNYAKQRAAAMVDAARNDATLRLALLDGLARRAEIADALRDTPGLRDLVDASIDRDHPEARVNLDAAAVLGLVIGDRPAAAELIAPLVESLYTGPNRRLAWGPHLELLLAIDPAHRVLDAVAESTTRSADPAAPFITWLLRIRRALDPGPLPADAWRAAFDHRDFDWLMVGLSRAGPPAAAELDRLRDPFALIAHAFMGLDAAGRLGGPDLSKCLALLAALDRLEWHRRNLPARLDGAEVR